MQYTFEGGFDLDIGKELYKNGGSDRNDSFVCTVNYEYSIENNSASIERLKITHEGKCITRYVEILSKWAIDYIEYLIYREIEELKWKTQKNCSQH